MLEIGAGPGRFTIELAEMGCRVVVSDISPVQLEANARRVAEAGLEGAVVERRLLDVRDLTALPTRLSTRSSPTAGRCRMPSSTPNRAWPGCFEFIDRAAGSWRA